MRRDMIVLRPPDSTSASRRSLCRRDTSARRDSASFAAWRASFACSTAAFSLRRDASKRDFHEPASQRATTSAQRNSSARACAASARARSRSARACSRSYGKRQSRGWRIGTASGKDRAPSSPAARVGAVSISSTRIAMGATIAHGGLRYPCPYRRSSERRPIPARPNGYHQVACGVTQCHCVSIRYVHFLEVLCRLQAALAAPSLIFCPRDHRGPW